MAIRTPKPPLEVVAGEDLAAKAAAAAEELDAEIDAVVDDDVEAQTDQLKMKELITEIVARTGQRKGEVRTAVQAALGIIGEALANERELHLPPMGKMKVNRVKETPRGQALMVKLVQNRRAAVVEVSSDDPLAEFEQDG